VDGSGFAREFGGELYPAGRKEFFCKDSDGRSAATAIMAAVFLLSSAISPEPLFAQGETPRKVMSRVARAYPELARRLNLEAR